MREIKFRAWDNRHRIMIQDEDIHGASMYGEIFASNRYEAMQYTGLQDKNRKEIYEGDVIEGIWYYIPGKRRMLVKWSDHFRGFAVDDYPLNIHGLYDIAVIGNIYENPELLEDTK